MNQQSLSAYKKAMPNKMQRIVLETIQELGKATLKDVSQILGKQKNELSGRFTELKRLGDIEPTGETKDGCAVYQLKDNQGVLF